MYCYGFIGEILAPTASQFSESSSRRKHMPCKIWLLYNNFDYSLSVIITTMNHYSCLILMWYSYLYNNMIIVFYPYFASFVLLLSLPPRSKAANMGFASWCVIRLLQSPLHVLQLIADARTRAFGTSMTYIAVTKHVRHVHVYAHKVQHIWRLLV